MYVSINLPRPLITTLSASAGISTTSESDRCSTLSFITISTSPSTQLYITNESREITSRSTSPSTSMALMVKYGQSINFTASFYAY